MRDLRRKVRLVTAREPDVTLMPNTFRHIYVMRMQMNLMRALSNA